MTKHFSRARTVGAGVGVVRTERGVMSITAEIE